MSTSVYINVDTLEYPVFEYFIGQDNPDIGTKYKEVQATEKPVLIGYEKLIELAPVEVDGVWYQQWDVVQNAMQPDEIIFSDLLNGPVKAPQVETVWVNKQIYRTAYSRALPEGYALYQELQHLFPDDMPVENRIDPNWIGKSQGAIREPYLNDTYSLYVWFEPRQVTFDAFNITDISNIRLVPWYGLKYDSVTHDIKFKLPYYETIPSTPKPHGLPDGGLFGKIYSKDGTIDLNVDYYIKCDADLMKQFCIDNGMVFPVPEEHISHVVLYGIVYNINTLAVSNVKGYDLRCPL